MKIASCKAKARRLQNVVCEDLRKVFGFTASDIKAAVMGESGIDIKLSNAARKLIPFAFECKATENLQLWAALDQAEDNATRENLLPALVFKRNRSDIYVALPWRVFLKLAYDSVYDRIIAGGNK